jgi:putative tricarboxylic transport membrane protein
MQRAAIIRALAAGSATLALLAPCATSAQDWKPAKNVEIIVAADAGGSSDRSARVVQKLLAGNPVFPSVSVNNRPGGGGTVAWTALAQHAPDAHYIATFSSTMLTNQILGVGNLTYNDFTPLTIMLREYVTMAVSASSPIASAKDLVDRLRKDPTSVSFTFSSAPGNHNHVIIGMVLKAAGADPKKAKVIVQKSGGQGMTAVLGGHIDVFVGAPANVAPHIPGNKVRVIGVSAPQRQTGALAGQPTLRENGIDAVFFSWRGFIGPKGMAPAQVAFWDQAFARAVQGEDWKKDVEMNVWAEDYMNSAATRKHLDSEYQVMTRIMNDLGVVPEKR